MAAPVWMPEAATTNPGSTTIPPPVAARTIARCAPGGADSPPPTPPPAPPSCGSTIHPSVGDTGRLPPSCGYGAVPPRPLPLPPQTGVRRERGGIAPSLLLIPRREFPPPATFDVDEKKRLYCAVVPSSVVVSTSKKHKSTQSWGGIGSGGETLSCISIRFAFCTGRQEEFIQLNVCRPDTIFVSA